MTFQCYCCVFFSVYCERKVLRPTHNLFRPMKRSYCGQIQIQLSIWKLFPHALVCALSAHSIHSSQQYTSKCQHVSIMQSDAQTVKEGKSTFVLLSHTDISKGALLAHTKLVLYIEEYVHTLLLKSFICFFFSINQQSPFLAKRHQL